MMEFVYSDKNPNVTVAYASSEAMHTVLEAVLVQVGEDEARSLAERIGKLAAEIDAKLNRYDENSLFARINASRGRESVRLDEETFVLLQLCEVFRKSTGGYFDISALSPCLHTPAYILAPSDRSIRLCGEDVILDAGGMGKGYALERMKKLLSDAGVEAALLNFGDSSIASVGRHPFGDCWKVAAKSGGGEFCLDGGSLSFSGLSPDGRAHIVDPKTRKTVSDDCMLAVEGRSAFVCEILSTALYAAPDAARREIISAFDGYVYKKIEAGG